MLALITIQTLVCIWSYVHIWKSYTNEDGVKEPFSLRAKLSLVLMTTGTVLMDITVIIDSLYRSGLIC